MARLKVPSMKQPIERIQTNLLAASERRLLTWLAQRLPPFITPDRLTSLGLLGAAGVGLGYALSVYDIRWLWLSIACYAINWFGDSLDGSLARFRKIERPNFGYFIDHSCDALGNMCIMVGIGLSNFVLMDVALLALAAYLLLSIHTFLAARVTNSFNLTYLGGGPTEMRFILIGMTIAMLIVGPGHLPGYPFSGFDIFVAGFAALLGAIFLFQTTRLGHELRALGK